MSEPKRALTRARRPAGLGRSSPPARAPWLAVSVAAKLVEWGVTTPDQPSVCTVNGGSRRRPTLSGLSVKQTFCRLLESQVTERLLCVLLASGRSRPLALSSLTKARVTCELTPAPQGQSSQMGPRVVSASWYRAARSFQSVLACIAVASEQLDAERGRDSSLF